MSGGDEPKIYIFKTDIFNCKRDYWALYVVTAILTFIHIHFLWTQIDIDV